MSDEQIEKWKRMLLEGNTTIWPLLSDSHATCELHFIEEGSEEFWTVYICHDPCHDDDEMNLWRDRNTVWACRNNFIGKPFLGESPFRILGRELPLREAYTLVHG